MVSFLKNILAYFKRRDWRNNPIKKISENASVRIGNKPSILVLKLDHIGDFITALDSFSRLRAAWPEAKITLLCAPQNEALARKLNVFDQIVTFNYFPSSDKVERNEKPYTAEKLVQFSKLRLGRYDIAIDLRHDEDTRPLLLLIDATFRCGYNSWRNIPLDIALPNVEDDARRAKTWPPLHAETQIGRAHV